MWLRAIVVITRGCFKWPNYIPFIDAFRNLIGPLFHADLSGLIGIILRAIDRRRDTVSEWFSVLFVDGIWSRFELEILKADTGRMAFQVARLKACQTIAFIGLFSAISGPDLRS